MTVDASNGIVTVTAVGILDAVTSADFRDECLKSLATADTGLIIDVEGVPFVASSGLGTFLLVTETGKRKQCPVVISGAAAPVREVLAMMNLVPFLNLQPDTAAANSFLKSVIPTV